MPDAHIQYNSRCEIPIMCEINPTTCIHVNRKFPLEKPKNKKIKNKASSSLLISRKTILIVFLSIHGSSLLSFYLSFQTQCALSCFGLYIFVWSYTPRTWWFGCGSSFARTKIIITMKKKDIDLTVSKLYLYTKLNGNQPCSCSTNRSR